MKISNWGTESARFESPSGTRDEMNAKQYITNRLKEADIEINGLRSWGYHGA